MTSSESLGKDARALIAAARGGDDIPADERLRQLAAFERRRANEPVARRGRSVGWAQRPARRAGWAVAALLLTGSLVALARHPEVLERLSAAVERVLSSAPAPRSRGSDPGVPLPAAPSPRAEPPAAPLLAPVPDELPAASLPAPRLPARGSSAGANAPASEPRGAAPRARPAARSVPIERIDARELELIVAARNALAERRYAAAREAAQRHAAEFARGTFSEEREAILALSDCRSGRGSERGHRFVERRPASLFAERIRRDCVSDNLVPGAEPPATH